MAIDECSIYSSYYAPLRANHHPIFRLALTAHFGHGALLYRSCSSVN
ncbi:Hypothetical protein BROD_0129 [Brucella sp. NF 2653]|uniref:Uncharacterized protein n=1 Tax=Brucella suis (strain ATCC 23445 / NCTC 10510) TaxID=470137 RepID=A9WXK1_BRUSI|nr:Hypothetical protein BSUIS_B0145 [Brucella suis ATCC 23445]EFM63736.1 Hypothetical protein BROD_0129 [Brucella sp. NF 2653]